MFWSQFLQSNEGQFWMRICNIHLSLLLFTFLDSFISVLQPLSEKRLVREEYFTIFWYSNSKRSTNFQYLFSGFIEKVYLSSSLNSVIFQNNSSPLGSWPSITLQQVPAFSIQFSASLSKRLFLLFFEFCVFFSRIFHF